MRALALIIVMLVLPATGVAPRANAEAGQRRSWKECMDTHGLPGMMDCIDVEVGYQDARLNRTYKRTMARLTMPQRTLLRASERQWLRTHERDCERDNKQMLTLMTCVLLAITKRADWLETYKP